MHHLRKSILALAALTAAFYANAAYAADHWLKAESRHFIVYSDQKEADLRAYAAMLEDFDSVLRAFHGRPMDEPVPRKLNVYLVKDRATLAKVVPSAAGRYIGEYIRAEEGMFIIAIRDDKAATAFDTTLGDDTVLHEYSHHFMWQYYANAYPGWYVEGFADYFMTADLRPEAITIGKVSFDRAYVLTHQSWMPMSMVLTRTPDTLSASQLGPYYAESWLLTHYLMDTPERREQFANYLRLLFARKTPAAALKAAFNQTPEDLDAVLQAYMKQSMGGAIVRRTWAAPVVNVTKLSSVAEDTLLLNLTMQLTRPGPAAERLLDVARKIASRNKTDRAALLTLAYGETRLGDRAAGEAILQTLISANPNDVEALRLLAVSKISRAEKNPADRTQLFRDAGQLIGRAEKIDPDNYQLLYRYAETRQVEPGYPNENTLNVLLKAVDLAPQIFQLRLVAGQVAGVRGEYGLARSLLEPVAADPHSSAMSNTAVRLLASVSAMERAKAAPPVQSTSGDGRPPPPLAVPPVKKEERIEQVRPPPQVIAKPTAKPPEAAPAEAGTAGANP